MKFREAFSIIDKNRISTKSDIFSGLTVALALVPEAVAFAFVAGISPIIGLYGAFMMGLITSIFGGRPGMISGATGALAVVMVHLVAEGEALGEGQGLQYLFATLVLTGIVQMSAGFLKLGKFIRMVPHSVMMGFVNGLAIVIFMSQLGMFKAGGEWLAGKDLFIMLGFVLLTMGIMVFLPRVNKNIPAALVAILVVSGIVILGGVETATVKSFIQDGGGTGIKAGLPSFNVPIIPVNMETLSFIFPYAVILAAIGLIESLMTLNLLDELTETRGNGNRECIAQGLANLTNGFFGGMGGCAMIGQSIINVKSGGRGRLSGVVAALALLAFILFGSTYIEMVPIAALVGVMFMVVIGTFAWSTFKIINKVPVSDVIVIVLVTGLTVIFDLAIAVFAGVIVSALVFAWENALRIRARKSVDEHGIKHYEIYGPLFFGSVSLFNAKFEVKEDPQEVIIDFKESRIVDQSAIEAINKLAEKYQKEGKTIHLRHLSKDCTRLIERAEKICDVNVLEDPDYFVAIDNYKKYKEATA
ncbi:SulP family inorganic anion transporter [Roseivirga pacifica]|uniref:SulP family inorganic anion transporter n=1 Tax=Roseivirga pacifica TaxID=1267423 RepID=UPI0020954842|nr:SulP family inorganic anion transporter [Roseivirga pacifica]MCO6358750.1 STAS domain-containing protein [Roseivirga pacifica]MCO6365614.1 STAS domain-containing protein [Roseivirga pacifica]MCO6371656.1 STAS domain-containing protein [Roseivirga pacifica]MCO6376233.1 STAS domain-containing protein [Roseivirga pacifica]MCO6379034.1 STAS domain-containing protein [Roseivirga pacifica]